MKFGIIGAGKMGSAIGMGVIRSNLFKKDEVIFADSFEPRIEELNSLGYKTLCNVELYQNADIVLLAVKPQQINIILEELSKVDKHAKTIITIAAGISISHIKSYLKDERMKSVTFFICLEIVLSDWIPSSICFTLSLVCSSLKCPQPSFNTVSDWTFRGIKVVI